MSTNNNLSHFSLYAKEAEETILGSILAYEDALPRIVSVLNAEMFYDLKHQHIYSAILKADKEGNPIDLVSVAETLKNMGLLEKSGNYAYLSKLTNYTADNVRIVFYARIVVQKFVQRELMKFGSRTIQAAQDEKIDVADVIAGVSSELERILGVMTSDSSMSHISVALEKAVGEVLEREKMCKQGRVLGVSTGLTGLDKMIAGWHGGDLVILAGRPGSGKTSVMLHFAKSAALTNKPACMYSLEMRSVSLADRLILSEADINAGDYRSGCLRERDFTQISKAQEKIAKLPLYVDDRSGVSMQYIRAHSRMMYKKGLCEIVLIDYLQLTTGNTAKNYNREQDIAQASAQAKALAKELNIPVVLLSQLNRDCEKRADKKPELSDLRESGAIEQDADMVMFVYRPEYYGIQVQDKDGRLLKNVGQLILAKHRNGPVGDVKFTYNESITKITDFVEPSPF